MYLCGGFGHGETVRCRCAQVGGGQLHRGAGGGRAVGLPRAALAAAGAQPAARAAHARAGAAAPPADAVRAPVHRPDPCPWFVVPVQCDTIDARYVHRNLAGNLITELSDTALPPLPALHTL